ncbi:hypothetical protein ACQJBY_040291 [Aegilops geniculata]
MEADGAAAAEAAKPLTPEEEALRRNTDCVYFLASPLTCKKGNQCDFRHSEGARMNPRDCYYWLNGNCLNPKCSFRHPPIDGMFGAPTPGIPAVSSHYAAYNSGKQMVPCYYFQKGNCIKGDKCPFSHGPQSAGNNPPEQVAKVSSFPLEQPQTQKNEFLGVKEFAQTNHLIQQGGPISDDRSKSVNRAAGNFTRTAAAAIPAELASSAVKSLPKSGSAQNGMPTVNKSFRTSSGEDHPECYQNNLPVETDPMQDWNQPYHTPPQDDMPEDSRDADDLLGESSPGFDVLVANDADAGAYMHDPDDFGRDIYPVEDYEYAPADFEIQPHHERELFNGMGEQGPIGQMYDGYDRKRRRTSSERNLDRPSYSERRSRQRETGPVEIDGSDLRHRLRRRKINGSPGISPERSGELRRRDDRYRERAYDGHRTHRDRHQGPRGSTLSSRLQGRIKLPGRSPDRVDARSERERDRRQLRDRLSPVVPMDIPGGRHREAGHHLERIRQRSSERASSARIADGKHSRRNVTDSLNFASRKDFGPESRKANGSVQSEASLDFEGPTPLSVILQRKRQAACGNGNGSSAHNVKEDKSAAVSHRQAESLVEAEKEGYDNTISSEEYKSRSGDEEYKEEGQVPASSSHGDKAEAEDMIEVENQEADNYEQRQGDSEYEATEGYEYKSEDENAYQDEDEEFEDDDDFARKVGVVFS